MSSLTVEEIQKSLSNSMMSMQIQMEAERESYKKKITALEKTNKEYKDKIDELTELMASKKNENEVFNKLIADLNSQIRKKEKELESKLEEHKKEAAEISNLNNQIQLKNQNIIQLQMEKKQLGEDFDKRCTLSQHELLVMQKK